MRTRVAAVVMKDGKFLMIHRHNQGEEYWVLPGGGVEEGESLEAAVLRELGEETMIAGELGEKLLDFVDGREVRHVVFDVKYVSGEAVLHADSPEANNKDPEQSYKPEWVRVDEFSGLEIYPKEVKEFLLRRI